MGLAVGDRNDATTHSGTVGDDLLFETGRASGSRSLNVAVRNLGVALSDTGLWSQHKSCVAGCAGVGGIACAGSFGITVGGTGTADSELVRVLSWSAVDAGRAAWTGEVIGTQLTV